MYHTLFYSKVSPLYRLFFTDIATEDDELWDDEDNEECPGGGVAVDLSLCAAFRAAYCVPSSAIWKILSTLLWANNLAQAGWPCTRAAFEPIQATFYRYVPNQTLAETYLSFVSPVHNQPLFFLSSGMNKTDVKIKFLTLTKDFIY